MWQHHIDLVASRMAKILFLIRSLFGVGLSILLDIYYTHVGHIGHGTTIWTSSVYVTKISILQKRAIRLLWEDPSRNHVNHFFVDLFVLSLPCALSVYNNQVIFKSLLSSLTMNADRHNYSTRHRNDLAM